MKKTYTILIIVSVLTIVFVLGYFAFKNYNENENDDNWLNSSGDIEIDTGFNDVSNEYWAKEYNVDIDRFCTKGPAHFSTISEWEKFNWKEKFKNAVFDVDIDIDVLSTMLITKT